LAIFFSGDGVIRVWFKEYAVAGTAFVVSICSLFIYIYQSKIMSEQQQVAAWPYVEWYTNNVNGYKLAVQNKGIGPAIVRDVSIKVDGKPLANNRELMNAVMGAGHQVGWVNAEVRDRVMSAGETTEILIIADPAQSQEFQTRLSQRKFELLITYCSIYGRCWTSSGFKITRAPDDSSTMY
jgi:hypothetical protein